MKPSEDETLRDERADPGQTNANTLGRAKTQPPPTLDLGSRYELGGVIGRGGMGEVRLARDTRIDREVAVKLMRGTERTEVDVTRFFREARVQGVLEHPAVVPVHDMGIDSNGSPYFVMKRLAGTTFAAVLKSDDAAVRARWPRRQLLQRLADICLAIDFAHKRGVIHRDIKPANLMLGDYGEAYVLDWGLARLSVDGESLDGVLPLSGDAGETQIGDLLGTPGYMSPAQARGEPVDRATDVFALGMVLYEVLAGRPALPSGMAAIAETLTTEHHRPSSVVPDVPPELDDLCARATDASAAMRPTARMLAEAIQAYLDGDRDTALRRDRAEQHAQTAQKALVTIAGASVRADDEARATAMREAGRAIALDPSNATAAHVLGRLLIEAPTEIPAAALVDADAERAESRRAVLAWAARGFTVLFVLTLVLFLLPLRSYWQPALSSGLCLGIVVVTRHMGKRPLPGRSPWFLVLFIASCTLLAVAGLAFGPILILPIFMIGAMAGFLSQPTEWPPWIVIGGLVVPILVLVLLEVGGALPPTFWFRDGALVLQAPILDLTPLPTLLLVAGSLLTQVVNTVFIATSTMKVQRAAQNRVHAQTWHLKQLLPGADSAKYRDEPR